MALRLGEYIIYGELRNTSHYSTHGFLVLRGPAAPEQSVLQFELTGNPSPDLQGKAIRFWPGDGEPQADFALDKFLFVKMRQIGPTSEMSADGWAKVLPCSPDEFLQRSRLGEPPPTVWVRRVYLEWFGQNGRVVVELPGAAVEHQVRAPEGTGDEGDWEPLPNLSPPPDLFDTNPVRGLEITMLSQFSDEIMTEDRPPEALAEPDALQWDLDCETEAIDRAIGLDSDEDAGYGDINAGMEWLEDYLGGRDDGTPLVRLLEDADQLPPPESLQDHEVEARLKTILAQLALLGVTLDVCEHYMPRDCYRLLVEKILPEYTAQEKLIGTDWVTHFSTWEDCPACEAEFETEYEAENEN